jgi:hypothetical protein
MLNRMKPAPEGGGRVAIVMNGSPLFTGDAGSGESEIRRWILENDWLEAIIALPEQLFYNTGIATYIWVLSNRKAPHRKGHVQLIDASDLWHPMRKSLGDKRREITDMHIAEIIRTYTAFEESARSKIFQTTDFGYRKVTIERPTRINFCTCEERLPRLEGKRAFQNLAKHRQSAPQAQSPGRDKQRAILTLLRQMPPTLYKDVRTFRAALKRAANAQGVKLYAAMRDAIVDALGQPDENAEIMVDRQGRPIPNTALRDYERVPLNEDVDAYFVREIQSYVPDAWLNKDIIDAKDGGIGRVGYEINFGHHFYQYKPPRPLDAIVSDLQSLETDIMSLLGEVTGEQREDAGPKRWPPYPQYKRSGVPWLAEIPRHWEDKKLKFVAAINMGQSPSSKDYNHEGNGPPFLQGNAEFGAKHPTPTLYCHTANKRAAPGDLLLSVRAPVGALNVADQSYGIGRGLCAITPNDNALDKDYAWYLLQITRTELDTLATGSTYEAVSVDEVRNMLCLTPPLSEQRAIATYLDHETARLDTLAAKVQEVIERLSEYRTALIAAVVTGKMDVR